MTAWIRPLLLITGCLLSLSNAYTTSSSIKPRLWERNTVEVKVNEKSIASFVTVTTQTPPSVSALRAGASSSADTGAGNGKLFKELLAEFLGTFLLVQIGCGSVMSEIFCGSLSGLFPIAAVWVVAVTIAIATTSSISGAHLNPSISVALALFRGFQWKKVIPYSIAQTMGAAAAAVVNLILFHDKIKAFEQANSIVRGTVASTASARAFGEYISDPVTTATAFFAEAFGTGVLAFVIFCLTNPRSDVQKSKVFVPPLIGATVGALICVIAPLTQAGFNPARDFGPRIVAWLAGWKGVAFTKWWLYVLAPLVGAPLGAALAECFLNND